MRPRLRSEFGQTRRLRAVALLATLCAPAAFAKGDGEVAPAFDSFRPHGGRALCRGTAGYAAAPGKLRTFLWRPEWLAVERVRVAADAAYAKNLRKAADDALGRQVHSVVDKSEAPASGDKHDYRSLGTYWWPAPNSAKGAPYVRRDGVANPERNGEAYDRARLARFSQDVQTLSLAYHHLGDRRYARQAARLLRTWFVDPATRMNPNLEHGQSIPGVVAGRPEGLIDTRELLPVIDSIGILGPSEALTLDENQALGRWFRDFAGWMVASRIGQGEGIKTNNHGLNYDVQLMQFSLFGGDEATARQVARDFMARRIAVQVAPDGRLPEELARTRSLHYSWYALEAMSRAATIAECSGVDLWTARTQDGRSLKRALSFLAPFRNTFAGWAHPEIAARNEAQAVGIRRLASDTLRMSAWGANDRSLDRLATDIDLPPDASEDYWLPPLSGDDPSRRGF